jgi:hypothetical protein
MGGGATMNSDNADDRAILSKLDRLNALVFARDPGVVDELWSDLGFRLIGSEQGESAATREELAALIEALFLKPIRISWVWKDRTLTRLGGFAWVCADGEIEIASPERAERRPYRLVCIFQKVDGLWRWRLFSGSEPAQ